MTLARNPVSERGQEADLLIHHSPIGRIRKMESVPRFLTLLMFSLLLGTGCAASRTFEVTAKVADEPPATTKSEPTVDKEPAGSMYQELVTNSALARYMRGEPLDPVEGEYICFPTGRFNVAPARDHLLMEIRCVERHPIEGGQAVHVRQVEDKPVPRLEGVYNLYRVPFQDSVVSVIEDVDASEVTLHYQDEDGEFHQVDLPLRSGEKYAFTFDHLSPDKVEPDGWVHNF